MSDKRLWHRKSSLKPEKLFEMKEKIGYIEQGEKIKGKKGNWEEQEWHKLGYKCQKLESNPQHLEFVVCCCTEHPSVSNGLWFQSIWK